MGSERDKGKRKLARKSTDYGKVRLRMVDLGQGVTATGNQQLQAQVSIPDET